MQKDLVSIITPCYNAGDIIHRLLDSILNQDFPLIEMLVVDDGSTDNSKEVIFLFLKKKDTALNTIIKVIKANLLQ